MRISSALCVVALCAFACIGVGVNAAAAVVGDDDDDDGLEMARARGGNTAQLSARERLLLRYSNGGAHPAPLHPALPHPAFVAGHVPALGKVCSHTSCEVKNGHTFIYDWHFAEERGARHHCVSDVAAGKCTCICGDAVTMSGVSMLVHDANGPMRAVRHISAPVNHARLDVHGHGPGDNFPPVLSNASAANTPAAIGSVHTVLFGASLTLPSGPVRLGVSAHGELVRVSKGGELAAARSYDGHAWESAPPALLPVRCPATAASKASPLFLSPGVTNATHSACEAIIPAGGVYEIEAYDYSKDMPGAKSAAARFLTRATFGPSRASVAEYATHGDRAAWVKAQMDVPATLHRGYFRERSNARYPKEVTSVPAGTLRSACSAGSRWNAFSFSQEDIGKTIVAQGNSQNVSLTVDGAVRTVVPASAFALPSALEPFTVCSVEEAVGGVVTLGAGCVAPISNPRVAFTSQLPVDAARVVVATTSDSFGQIAPAVTDSSVLTRTPLSNETACRGAPALGPLFAVAQPSGEMYVHDRRVALSHNTLGNPALAPVPSSLLRSECPAVPKTFLNQHDCVIGHPSCAGVRYAPAPLVLNDTSIQQFYALGAKRVHVISGLDIDSRTKSPCTKGDHRWIRQTGDSSTCGAQLSDEVRSTLANAITSALAADTRNNANIVDAYISGNDEKHRCDASVAAGIVVVANGACYKHVHGDSMSVYDFTKYSLYHSEVNSLAPNGDTTFIWPGSVGSWATATKSNTFMLSKLGRLGDTVDFTTLPSNVQIEPIARWIGAETRDGDSSTESCGSPGEVANEPLLGHRYFMALGEINSEPSAKGSLQKRDRSPDSGGQNKQLTKSMVWENVVLKAPDQLRQRMAWALSQILVINEDDVNKPTESESWANYYDIFVRHAFGNYRDVLREVAYSPMMAKMLTFLNSRSRVSSGFFPDENFARETMQLFTFGVWQLHENGTRVRDANGDPISTYTVNDVSSIARAWTGFSVQQPRGNVEHIIDHRSNNFIDPMRIVAKYRDQNPKAHMSGYLGDRQPLCADLPPKHFLRKGAVYRYLGKSRRATKLDDPSWYDEPFNPSNPGPNEQSSTDTKFLELSASSPLFLELCNFDPARRGCQFRAVTTLASTVACDANDCLVDTARVVTLLGAGKDAGGATYDVHFEYVQPPCVNLAYFENPALVTTRAALSTSQKGQKVGPQCADTSSAIAASAACCTKTFVEHRQPQPDGVKLVVKWNTAASCTENTACGTGTSLPRWYIRVEDTNSTKQGTPKPSKAEQTATYIEGSNGATFPIYRVQHFAHNGKNLYLFPVENTANYEASLMTKFNELFPKGTTLTVKQNVTVLGDTSKAWCESQYTNEKVSFGTAKARCESKGMQLCDFTELSRRDRTCEWHNAYFWSTATRPCAMQAQVDPDGAVNIVDSIPGLPSSVPAQHPEDGVGKFRVHWLNGAFPKVGDGCGTGGCKVSGTSCLCDTTVEHKAAFGAAPPSASEAHKLTVGATDPGRYDPGTFARCSSAACTSQPGVTVWLRGASTGTMDIHTVFEVEGKFYRNLESTVRAQGFAFRNPPSFHSRYEQTVRDAEYETEATLDWYFGHPSVPPFVAKLLIQRFGTSNPSPRYTQAVATAFKTGSHGEFGSGTRGDLSATLAAILLDREVDPFSLLENEANHGGVREPLLKLIHVLRALEFAPDTGFEEIILDDKISQFPWRAPSVFSFFSPTYTAGAVQQHGLVAPEAALTSAPDIINWLNAVQSTIRWGLTGCDGGTGIRGSKTCSRAIKNGVLQAGQGAGELSYAPSGNTTASGSEVVAELDVLLTGGRLNAHSRAVIASAYERQLASTSSASEALKTAQQLMVTTPEFHTTSANRATKVRRSAPPPQVNGNTAKRPYKAVVYLFLSGGADSYNMIAPYDGCTGNDMYAQYASVRDNLAIPKADLLPIDATVKAPNSSQVCARFGLHPKLSNLQRQYNNGDALFVANAGPLIEPVTKSEYLAKTKRVPKPLFGHRLQTHLTKNLLAHDRARQDGVLGRMADTWARDGVGAGSYSIWGSDALALEPQHATGYDVVSMEGVPTLSYWANGLRGDIEQINTWKSTSPFAELWMHQTNTSLARTGFLSETVEKATLSQEFEALDATAITEGRKQKNNVGRQLKQVAKLIAANTETLHNERDAFYVQGSGFDDHSDTYERYSDSLAQIDAALASFEAEMKLQGLWDNVTIVQMSEFGRTLTSNGDGTDHAWAGNIFVTGGSVRGGQILGDYPYDLTEASDLNVKRGRLIPTTSWEHVWNGVGEWLGVTDQDMDTVLPNRRNFPDLFTRADMFDV